MCVVLVLAAVVFVGMSVFGMLTLAGYFRKPTLAQVVSVEQNGDLCIRAERASDVDCVPNLDGIEVHTGDCVLVYYGEGIRVARRTQCPD